MLECPRTRSGASQTCAVPLCNATQTPGFECHLFVSNSHPDISSLPPSFSSSGQPHPQGTSGTHLGRSQLGQDLGLLPLPGVPLVSTYSVAQAPNPGVLFHSPHFLTLQDTRKGQFYLELSSTPALLSPLPLFPGSSWPRIVFTGRTALGFELVSPLPLAPPPPSPTQGGAVKA